MERFLEVKLTARGVLFCWMVWHDDGVLMVDGGMVC